MYVYIYIDIYINIIYLHRHLHNILGFTVDLERCRVDAPCQWESNCCLLERCAAHRSTSASTTGTSPQKSGALGAEMCWACPNWWNLLISNRWEHILLRVFLLEIACFSGNPKVVAFHSSLGVGGWCVRRFSSIDTVYKCIDVMVR